VRRTALGAIRHALRGAAALPPDHRLGLYTGQVGIALAAAHVGAAVGECWPVDQARDLLRRVVEGTTAAPEPDLLSGSAGAIVGLAAAHALLGDSWLLEHAARLGDELLAQAIPERVGHSWRSAAHPTRHNLTGFAHGAAGIGYALLELYRKTGESRYRAGGAGAFSYEGGWFDAGEQNWADLRRMPRRARGRAFAHAWCHGAPGIAISRLRAYQLLGDSESRQEALAALQCTERATRQMLRAGDADHSLCHGLAGNAAILAYGRHMLGAAFGPGRQVVAEVAAALGQRYLTGERQAGVRQGWSAGGGDVAPGLMIGVAGVGAFFLGLADPALPLFLTLAGGAAEDQEARAAATT
jgi:lantibiotic modifying enzyme